MPKQRLEGLPWAFPVLSSLEVILLGACRGGGGGSEAAMEGRGRVTVPSICVSLRTCSHTLAGAQTPQTNSHGCRDAQRHKMQSPCLTPRRSRGHRHWALQHTETQIHAYILLLDVSCKRPERRDLVGEQPLANSRSVRGLVVVEAGLRCSHFPIIFCSRSFLWDFSWQGV